MKQDELQLLSVLQGELVNDLPVLLLLTVVCYRRAFKGGELPEHRLQHSTVPVPPFIAVDFPPLPSDAWYGFQSPINSYQEKSVL